MGATGPAAMLAVAAGVSLAAAVATSTSSPVIVRAVGAGSVAPSRVDRWGGPTGVLRAAGSWPLVRRVPFSRATTEALAVVGPPLEPGMVRGARALAALAGAALGISLAGPAGAFALALLAGVVPPIVVGRMSRARRRSIDAELPQLLDLLAAASRAGLGGPLALRRAIDALDGPLANEVAAAICAIELGARWRVELQRLADRLDLPDLTRTVAALTRSERLGASLADAVTDLSTRVRADRRAAMTERARTAPVKMLFPLVFLVLPAFLLLTVVPVLFSTVRSIG